jgi:hypothetical protein
LDRESCGVHSYHRQYLVDGLRRTQSLSHEGDELGISAVRGEFIAHHFSMAMLSLKATQGAASVVLPFAQLIIERFAGKKDTVSMTVTPPAPGQPPAGNVVVTKPPEGPA